MVGYRFPQASASSGGAATRSCRQDGSRRLRVRRLAREQKAAQLFLVRTRVGCSIHPLGAINGESAGAQLILARSTGGVRHSVSPPPLFWLSHPGEGGTLLTCMKRGSNPRARAIMRRSYSGQYSRLSRGEPWIVAPIALVAKLDKAPDYESGDVRVRLLPSAPNNLRVGKPGNPPDLESGDRWIEASHADHRHSRFV